MERLRQIFEYTKAHLGQMSPTQKMLIGSAVIIMGMAMFMVSQYSSRSKMLTLDIDADSVSEAISYLDRQQIKYETSGTSVKVPSDRYLQVVQGLTQAGMMGPDAIKQLMTSIQSQQWWAPREQNQQAMNAALSHTLTSIVTGWSYISRATIIVQSPLRRPMIGLKEPAPTASAEIHTRGGSELTKSQVRAIADFISGAVPDLKAENVKVIDASNGRSMRVKDSGSFDASNYSELRSQVENEYEEKIFALLRHIPNVIVAVNAQLDIAAEQRFERDFKKDGAGTVLLPLSEQTNTSEEKSGGLSGTSGGVQPNTGTSLITRSSNGGKGRTSNEEKTNYTPGLGMTELQKTDPKGYAKKVRASINVPRQYYVQIWKMANADATDPPDDAALQGIIDSENQKITDLVREQIDTSAFLSSKNQGVAGAGSASGNGDVTVHMYYDFDDTAGGGGFGSMEANSGGGGILAMFGGDSAGSMVKTIAVSTLALVSIFLMFRLIRSGTTRQKLPTAEELVGIPPSLEVDDDEIVGMAAGGEPAMEALELDDDEMRSRNLMEQVEEMVSSNPGDAARLIGRWAADE